MPPETAGACAPGIPDSGKPSLIVDPILDMVCIHAAACDLAIADPGFRTMGENITVMASLHEKTREAHMAFPKLPGTEGVLALIDFQFARLLAADIQVRRVSYLDQACSSLWGGAPISKICAAAIPSWEACVHAHPVNCPCAGLCYNIHVQHTCARCSALGAAHG